MVFGKNKQPDGFYAMGIVQVLSEMPLFEIRTPDVIPYRIINP